MSEIDPFESHHDESTRLPEAGTRDELRLPSESETRHLLAVFAAVNRDLSEKLRAEHGHENFPPRPYHTLEHSEYVNARMQSLFDQFSKVAPWMLLEVPADEYAVKNASDQEGVMRLLSIYRAYAQFLAFGHDIVQEAMVGDGEMLERKRGMSQGENEFESIQRMIALLNEHSHKLAANGHLQIIPEHEDRIHRDIAATYPEFRSDEQGQLSEVVQPLAEKSSFLGQILAHADLYAQYANTWEMASSASRLEFLETHVWALQMMATHQTADAFSEDEVMRLFDAWAAWSAQQPAFMQALARGHAVLRKTVTEKAQRLAGADTLAVGRILQILDAEDHVEVFSQNKAKFESAADDLNNAQSLEQKRAVLEVLLSEYRESRVAST